MHSLTESASSGHLRELRFSALSFLPARFLHMHAHTHIRPHPHTHIHTHRHTHTHRLCCRPHCVSFLFSADRKHQLDPSNDYKVRNEPASHTHLMKESDDTHI